MRRPRRRGHDDTEIALTNFALTFAKALLVVSVMLVALIAPSNKKDDGVKPKMEYMISAEWPGEMDYDVDVWIKDPQGRVLYYGNREVGFLNLERDDLGALNNAFLIDGKIVKSPANVHQEIVAVRGFEAGEYIVNVHLYRAGVANVGVGRINVGQAVDPVKVAVRIEKLNPTVERKFTGEVTLTEMGQEEHVLRFNMSEAGEIGQISRDLPVSIRERNY